MLVAKKGVSKDGGVQGKRIHRFLRKYESNVSILARGCGGDSEGEGSEWLQTKCTRDKGGIGGGGRRRGRLKERHRDREGM